MKVVFNGNVREVATYAEAKAMADAEGLDLIEVAAGTYKILDYGKYLYEQKKKNKQNAQTPQQCKELQLGLCIDSADLDRKINDACRWLSEGKNVRVTMRLRGRLAMKESMILDLFNRVISAASERNLLLERPTIKKADSENSRRDLSVLMRTNVNPHRKGGTTNGTQS